MSPRHRAEWLSEGRLHAGKEGQCRAAGVRVPDGSGWEEPDGNGVCDQVLPLTLCPGLQTGFCERGSPWRV